MGIILVPLFRFLGLDLSAMASSRLPGYMYMYFLDLQEH